MPIATAAVYRVRTYGIYSGNRTAETLNVWHYSALNTPIINPAAAVQSIASDLATHMKDVVLPKVAAIQHNVHRYERITVDTVAPTSNIGEILVDIPISIQGAISIGECLPPTAAWTFRMLRSAPKMRNGYKRFSGLAEVNAVNGVVIGLSNGTPIASGASIERLQEVTAAIVEPLYGNTVGTADDIYPVIYSEEWHGQPVPAPFIQFVSFCQLRIEVGSQRTRRR